MSVRERYLLGAILYVPGTAVTSLPELHRKYGAEPKLVWLPGVVSDCSIINSSTGRKQKYITASWCYGNGDFKVKMVSLSVTLLKAPDGTRIPEDVQLIEERLLLPIDENPLILLGQTRLSAVFLTVNNYYYVNHLG